MKRLALPKAILIMLAFAGLGYAQQYTINPSPNAPAYDYFTAEQASNKVYRDLVTSAHTDKIPGWIRDGRMQNAIDEVVYTLDRFANHPKGLQMASIVAALIKKPSLATFYFEKAVKLYPQYAITHAQYGAYLVGNDQLDAGIARLKQAVEVDPKLAAAYALLARAYNQNGNSQLAREAAEKARELGYKGNTSGQ